MLIDKSYYDYDYSEPDEKYMTKQNAAKNDDELKALLSHLGIKANKPKLTEDEVIDIISKEYKERKEKSK